MSKGNLIRIEHSDLSATLELLDHHEVTPGDFDTLRKASSWQQMITASVLKGDPYLLKLLELEVPLKKAGFSPQEISSLAGEEDQLRNFRKVLLGNADIRNRPRDKKRTYKILRPVAPTPTVNRLFRADDTFFKKNSGVKMVGHGSNFTSWFTGKVEEDAPEEMPVSLTLTRGAYDNEIITDLGGEAVAEVTLTETWRLMESQANGEEGTLLNNGWGNIFYVRDVNGVLRAVGVFWDDDGWYVFASALDDGGWRGGFRVFSRNS